ncbi:MAG: hypothetical protein MK081_13665 [Flavobacteriales bacterium]|nr:hypothetical protein [Flavobacteriales bacterium]
MKNMTYKILYIEDLNPDSIMQELSKEPSFDVVHWKPDTIEDIDTKIADVNAIVMDFRLTEGETKLDGSSYAQAIRTIGSDIHKNLPIVLFSDEDKITDYYKDFTSQDLFDFSIPKDSFRANPEKYNTRILSLLNAYRKIEDDNRDLAKILGVNDVTEIDYRIDFTLMKETYAEDVYPYSRFILQNMIRSIGLLIGEDILSARLGISKDSGNWEDLKAHLEEFKYTGIFSDSYNRWWAKDISNWFNSKSENNSSLRRLAASERCEAIKKITGLSELDPLTQIDERGYKAKSSKFWTICKATHRAIDYSDGFELYLRDLKPWQEPEFISFLGISNGSLMSSVKPADKARIRKIEQSLRS